MTPTILSIIEAFSSVFTRPTWKKMQILLLGAILCRGPRCITNILRVMDLKTWKNFSQYHHVLSRAEWSNLALSKILLGLLIMLVPPSWPILIAIDSTLERRNGKKIKAKGAYRDAVRSSQTHVVTCFGLQWECMALIISLPWCKRPWACPFMVLLSPSKKANEEAGKRHKTSIDWAQQMVKQVSRWLSKKSWTLLADGAYACMALAKTCAQRNVTFISRLRLDAQLFKFPETPPPGKRGRKRVKGDRIQLRTLLADSTKKWKSLKVKWYGNTQKTIKCLSFTCLWYHAGEAPIKLRIVLVKTPNGKNAAEVFCSTNTKNTPAEIIERYILRWNIEVTFEEVRAHLGVETQRQWSDKAIARTTPLLMGTYSVVALIGLKMHEKKPLEVHEKTSWYNKNRELTFADIIIAVKRSIWAERYFPKSENTPDLFKLPNQSLTFLLDQIALAG